MPKKEAPAGSTGHQSQAHETWLALTSEASRLEALVSLQREVATSGAPLAELLRLVASRAQDLTSASGAAIALPDGEVLLCASATGSADGHLGERVPQLGTILGKALRSGEPVLCEATSLAGEIDRTIFERMGVGSLLAVALVSATANLGVLVVFSPAPRAFTGQHVQALQLIAGMLAVRLELAAERQSKHALATHDDLTGLYNRREMTRLLAEEIVRGRRHERPVSLLLIDLDRFKQVNDTFGPSAGDLVLQAVSATVCESVRSLDRVARYGGEELAVILPETSQAQAVIVAERIRTRVAQRAVELNLPDAEANRDSITVTISVGVGCSTALPEITAERLVRSTDQALLAAKQAGRNRSVTAKFRS
jgi:diguanylate cyclase (GGDEF)-like protein